MYLFGHLQGHRQQRRIYEYVCRHWREWFPTVPSYQAFNRRLNLLIESFEQLISNLLTEGVARLAPEADRLIDSLPIMLAKGTRSTGARVAREVADQGFCAIRQSYYYGLKLHAVALSPHQTVALACSFALEPRFAARPLGLARTRPALGRVCTVRRQGLLGRRDQSSFQSARHASANSI